MEWDEQKSKVAILLSQGYTNKEAADEAGISDRTVYRWKEDIEFQQEINRLSLMVDIASRAERLRIAMRMVRNSLNSRQKSNKDILDWLKFAQSETDGVKLDLTSLTTDDTSVAGSGQNGDEPEERLSST